MGPLSYDVVVFGGGPAGSVTARELARAGLRVAQLERQAEEVERVGENLPAAARPLLAALGLLERVARLEPRAAPAMRSHWGNRAGVERSALLNPYGEGWHLDRLRFDRALWEAASEEGVVGQRGVACGRPRRVAGGWQLEVGGAALEARFLVDATGRGAWLSRQLGRPCRRVDQLCGVAFTFEESAVVHATVEAVEEGWWYTAPLPRGRAVSIGMMDAAMVRERRRSSGLSWDSCAAGSLTATLHAGRSPTGPPRVWPAHSQCCALEEPEGWLPAGDAALSFDPLSALGLSFALVSAREASRAIAALLMRGEAAASRRYVAGLQAEFAAYLETRRQVYERERRWPRSAFWLGRQGDATGQLAAAAGR